MKVILKQDIKGVGKKDQVINAADGYARNYLFPKNLAVPADSGNMNNLKAKQDSESFRKNEDLKASKALTEKMKSMTLEFKVKAGENGRLFGAITAKEIAENHFDSAWYADGKTIPSDYETYMISWDNQTFSCTDMTIAVDPRTKEILLATMHSD